MEEFKRSLKVRRETVLGGLRHKMDALRSENQFLKELLELHNIECPPLQEITAEPEVETDNLQSSTPGEEGEDEGGSGSESLPAVVLEEKLERACGKCEDLESEIVRMKRELSRTQSDLQEANAQLLEQTAELQRTNNHCQALKDVNRIIKELIGIRDQELTQLKEKLKEIEQTMSERETEMLSEHLRTEYTRQLENIRRLKTLYEQRARSADAEIEILKRKIADKQAMVDNELLKNQEKEQRIAMNETEITRLNAELSSARDALKDNKNEMELVQNDLRAINMLFTRILTNKDNFDLDRLKNVLEENRMLITEVTMRSNDCSIIADSVLPKLLCDLIVGAFAEPEIPVDPSLEVEPVEEKGGDPKIVSYILKKPDLLSTDEIIENLPKIWRILTELLIHQKTTQMKLDDIGNSEDCYKTVDTPQGPQLVLSVSKTFIKLKDLIMEKKGLQKETKRLKVLNEHLQQTLNCQEDRLGAVSVEVTKTWHLVNRMQRQHRQLHTKEQVLRYHLQQKRRMVNVLKDELESCRHKWTKAKEKNENSEIQWRLLRDEFTSRKDKSNSVESGFSDDQEDTEDNAGVKPVATQPPQVQSFAVHPIDETLEEMFYRLNAIHTVNSLNFQPVAEEPPISPVSLTESERESHFELNRNDNFAENPPELIDVEAESHVQDETVVVVVNPEIPSTSTGLTAAEQEFNDGRNERIRRLEEQCKALFDKVTSNKKKGEELSEQLDTVHKKRLERKNSQAKEEQKEDQAGSSSAPAAVKTDAKDEFKKPEIEAMKTDSESSPVNTEVQDEAVPSTSSGLTATEEEYTIRRDERIKRLELQSKELFEKMNSNKKKGEELSDQLDNIHTRQLERNPPKEDDNGIPTDTADSPDPNPASETSSDTHPEENNNP